MAADTFLPLWGCCLLRNDLQKAGSEVYMCDEVTGNPCSWLVSIFIMPSLFHVITIVHLHFRNVLHQPNCYSTGTVSGKLTLPVPFVHCSVDFLLCGCRHSGKGNVASKYCSHVEWGCCTAVVFRLLWYCHNWTVAMPLRRNCSDSIATACMAADQCVSFAPCNVTETWWCSLLHWHIALFTFTLMHCQFLHIYKG